MTIMPTIQQILEALAATNIDAKESRDGQSVVIGYGHAGYIRVTPDYVISGGAEVPAAEIKGAPSGRRHAEVAAALRHAGIYPTH